MGQGAVTADTVSAMLGTLDNDQPLALIEALTTGEGGSVMSLLQQAASRGVEWEALLVEMLRLLHCIAMLQLLPSTLDEEFLAHEQQLRELARKLPLKRSSFTTRRCSLAEKSLLTRRISVWGSK